MKIKLLAAVAFAALGVISSPALAQTEGGVDIGRDAKITVTQDGPVIAASIGSHTNAHNVTGSIAGTVKVGRDVTIDVHQRGPVIAAAIGSDATASNVTGSIISKPTW